MKARGTIVFTPVFTPVLALVFALVFALALMLTAPAGRADDNAAARLVMEQTTERLLERLRAEEKAYHKDAQLLYSMLEEVVLPVVDMHLISRLALGEHWKTASKPQQQRFVENFRHMLMKSYGKTLLLLPDMQIKYEQPSPDQAKKKYQIIRTQMLTDNNKPPLSVHYSLIDRDGWKVFDIIIDGTSIAKQFRSGFDQEIREAGFDALLERLGKFDADEAPPMSLDSHPSR